MFNTFNMGVGMSVTVPREQADRALAVLREQGEEAYVMGEITAGGEQIENGGRAQGGLLDPRPQAAGCLTRSGRTCPHRWRPWAAGGWGRSC